MIKTTEELKREMHKAFFDAQMWGKTTPGAEATLNIFEAKLETYLEALRLDAEKSAKFMAEVQKYSGILSDAYERQQQLTHAACASDREAWAENYELKARIRDLENGNANGFDVLMSVREERDELRNKLQAFEFANEEAGKQLRAARITAQQQRQTIGQLKNDRDNARHTVKVRDTQLQKARKELSELRESFAATSPQDEAQNVAIEALAAMADASKEASVQICMHPMDSRNFSSAAGECVCGVCGCPEREMQ